MLPFSLAYCRLDGMANETTLLQVRKPQHTLFMLLGLLFISTKTQALHSSDHNHIQCTLNHVPGYCFNNRTPITMKISKLRAILSKSNNNYTELVSAAKNTP